MKNIIFILTLSLILLSEISTFAQDSQGFFLDDFQPKMSYNPKYQNCEPPSVIPTIKVSINVNDTIAKVSKYIYGNNANIYMTQMVTEPNLIKYIRDLSPKIIRYPGGNLTNQFFWNEKKGNHPPDVLDSVMINPKMKKSDFWYGMSDDTLTLSLDNYYLMLKQTQSTGLICVNFGYSRYGRGPTPVQTAAHLAADWVRYDKGRTRFWEVGNENYGPWQAGFIIDTTAIKNGQPAKISGELYGTNFKIFADSMRKAAKEINSDIKLGAVIVELNKGKSWYNPVESNWNEGFFKTARNAADFFSIHSYFTPYNENSSPATILNSSESETRAMMDYMKKMCNDYNVQFKPVALTEWNIFALHSKQSCSFINGMHAVLVLGELIKNQYGEASRWDLANRYNYGNDHGMFNWGDEPGVPRWNPRPVYFYMYYFQKFFGNYLINSPVEGNKNVVVYASKFKSGQLGIVVVNKDSLDQTISFDLKTFKPGKRYYFYSLTGGKDNGKFSQCVFVNGVGPDYNTGGPVNNLENIKAFSCLIGKEIKITSPRYSVQYILIENQN